MEIEKTQENTSFVINETEKPNSFEFGKASFRHKIYYKDIKELKQHIADLKAEKLFEEGISEFD